MSRKNWSGGGVKSPHGGRDSDFLGIVLVGLAGLYGGNIWMGMGKELTNPGYKKPEPKPNNEFGVLFRLSRNRNIVFGFRFRFAKTDNLTKTLTKFSLFKFVLSELWF